MHAILTTPKTLLKSFLLASDRAYFARPVAVLVHCGPPRRSEVGTITVTDPHRGHTYTTNPKWVVAA